MKVARCRLCDTTIIGDEICDCGNVSLKYWDDGMWCTVAMKDRTNATVYGYHNLWVIWQSNKREYKNRNRISYYLFYPYTLLLEWFVKIRIYSTTGKRVWVKPWSQARCVTAINGVLFYTYD